MLKGLEKEQRAVKCPRCHDDIKLPDDDLKGLKCHPFLQRILEEEKIDMNIAFPNGGLCEFCDQKEAISLCSICNQIGCDACQKRHKKQKVSKDHEFVSLDEYDPRKKISMCSIHPDHELAVFCQSCQINICALCLVNDHHNHDYIILKDKSKEIKSELKSSKQKVFLSYLIF